MPVAESYKILIMSVWFVAMVVGLKQTQT